jgi:hypothetical protein
MNTSVWNICEIILKGEGQTNRRKIRPVDTIYTTDPTVSAEDGAPDFCFVKASDQLPYPLHGLIFVWVKSFSVVILRGFTI